MLFRNASEIQNDRVSIFLFGRPGSLRSPSGYPLYSLRSCRSYPCRDRISGRGGILHSVTSWCPTRNTQPVLPRHTRRQVLSSSQRAADGHTAHSYPTLHVGLSKFAPSGSLSIMSHRQQASNKEIPSIWRLTEWWCREYTPWGKMGGGGDCNKFGARAPAAHLPPFYCVPVRATIPLPTTGGNGISNNKVRKKTF